MALIDYKALAKTYNTGNMHENTQFLNQYDIYHCLLAGNSERTKAVKKRVSYLPEDFQKWLEVCDGGKLFDTVLLTTKTHDDDLDLDFYTYGFFSNAEMRQNMNLSKDWFIFAFAVHNDLFFFDIEKKDGQVYQWDIEENTIYAFWSTFEDWLSDQIHEAISLIANEQLMPFLVKMEIQENE
jgi:hypothetical protein